MRPLPFPHQESIEVISKVDPLAGKYVEEMAYPELGDLEENIHDFEFVAVMPTSLYGYARVLQTSKGTPVEIESTPVSQDFFCVLGVSPTLGRNRCRRAHRRSSSCDGFALGLARLPGQ